MKESTFFHRYKEILLGVFMIALASFYLYHATLIRTRSTVSVSVKLMPEILGGIVIVLGICQLVSGVKYLMSVRRADKESGTPSVFISALELRDAVPVILTFIAIFLYAWSYEWLGIVFSFLGTVLSIIALMFISPSLAKIAIEFGNYEYFSIAFFSLTMIATLSGAALVKGIFSGTLGFMFATVGIAPIDSARRFTFGNSQLLAGFSMLAVMIGLFAVGEIIATAKDAGKESKEEITQPDIKSIKGFGFTWKEFLSQQVNMIRSYLIGLGIGILPGIGGGTSNILAYSVAKNQSKHPEKFGIGIIDGIVAPETSNNAAIGGAMIPLLTLGIPGDTVTAMLLGGLMIHGISPGPRLFVDHTNLVYAIFAAMVLASFIMLFLEFYGLRVFVKLLSIPKHILLPVIFCLCGVGAYGLNSRIFDIWSVILFGIIGFGFSVFKIPVAPFILGFILGPMAETHLRRGLMLHQNSLQPLYTSPICLFFLAIAVLSVGLTAYKQIQRSRRQDLVHTLSGRTFNKDGEEEEPNL